MDIFKYQFTCNEIYRRYCEILGKNPENVFALEQLPFLPAEFFKTHVVKSGNFKEEKIFGSSGTTGTDQSKHYVAEQALYDESYLRCFNVFFGKPESCVILALLPSYMERNDSSLIYMVEGLMKKRGREENGFFLYDYEALHRKLKSLEEKKQKTLLIGVSFALLDFAEKFPINLESTIIMETGGMKGRREEITREELHNILCEAFAVENICSEYGMTELLSQAYSHGEGKFQCPPWMKILIRDLNDPGEVSTQPTTIVNQSQMQSGAANIIDLANLDSCSFIATQDIIKFRDHGAFEVLGRMDFSDVRGCNLLLE